MKLEETAEELEQNQRETQQLKTELKQEKENYKRVINELKYYNVLHMEQLEKYEDKDDEWQKKEDEHEDRIATLGLKFRIADQMLRDQNMQR